MSENIGDALLTFDIKYLNIIDYIISISVVLTEDQKRYIFNSISKARAYLNINANFICPPPKPHVGYFNVTGNTIDMSGFTVNFKPFVDEYGIIVLRMQGEKR